MISPRSCTLALALTLGGLLWVLALPGSAAFAFDLEVRSSAKLWLSVAELGRKPVIRGRLMDNVNQGVASATLRLRLWPGQSDSLLPGSEEVPRIPTRTDQNYRENLVLPLQEPLLERELRSDGLGYFELSPELADGDYLVVVDLVAAPLYDHTQAIARFEVRRHPMQLDLRAPYWVQREQARAIEFSALASVPALPVDPPQLRLRAADTVQDLPLSGDELSFPWLSSLEQRRVYRGKRSVLFDLALSGAQQATLSFEGNTTFEPASSSVELFFYQTAELDFEAEQQHQRGARGVWVSGSLRLDGASRADAPVLIQVSQRSSTWRVVTELRCDEQGRFEALLPIDRLPHGEVFLRASFAPDYGLGSSSEARSLELDAMLASGWLGRIMVMLGVALGLALLFFFARQAWLRWRQRHRFRRMPSSEAVLRQLEQTPTGRQPSFQDLIGVLFVAVELRALSSGSVELHKASQNGPYREQSVRENGSFALFDLDPGDYELRAGALGFVSGRFPIRIPLQHAKAIRVDLVSVRQRSKQIYQWMLSQYSPDLPLWGKSTPREVALALGRELELQLLELREFLPRQLLSEVDAALGSGDSEAQLRALTAFFEELYFGHRLYPERVLELFESLCRTVLQSAREHSQRTEQRRRAVVAGSGLRLAELGQRGELLREPRMS